MLFASFVVNDFSILLGGAKLIPRLVVGAGKDARAAALVLQNNGKRWTHLGRFKNVVVAVAVGI